MGERKKGERIERGERRGVGGGEEWGRRGRKGRKLREGGGEGERGGD